MCSSDLIGVDAGILIPFELMDRQYEAGIAMMNLMAPSFTEEGETESSYATNTRIGISTKVELFEQFFLLDRKSVV